MMNFNWANIAKQQTAHNKKFQSLPIKDRTAIHFQLGSVPEHSESEWIETVREEQGQKVISSSQLTSLKSEWTETVREEL